MVIINSQGYISRRSKSCKPSGAKRIFINWFLVKQHNKNSGIFTIGKCNVMTPSGLIGKRIRIKLEVIKDVM